MTRLSLAINFLIFWFTIVKYPWWIVYGLTLGYWRPSRRSGDAKLHVSVRINIPSPSSGSCVKVYKTISLRGVVRSKNKQYIYAVDKKKQQVSDQYKQLPHLMYSKAGYHQQNKWMRYEQWRNGRTELYSMGLRGSSVVRSVRTAAQLNGSWSAVPGKAVSCGRGLRVPLFSVHVIQLSTNLPTYALLFRFSHMYRLLYIAEWGFLIYKMDYMVMWWYSTFIFIRGL